MNGAADMRHHRLRAFVLASVIAHGIALIGWATSTQFGGQMQTVLSVNLVTDESLARPTVARINESSNAAKADTRDAATENRATAARTSAQPAVAPADDKLSDPERQRNSSQAIAASSTDATGANARAQIQARLRADLARHFDYPWLARLRGWEGSVLLGFIVRAGGSLNDVRVVRSSGFAVLDRSAVDSLQKIERIPEAVAWLQGRDIEMQLPIVYRLKGER